MRQFSRTIIGLTLVFTLSLPGNAIADPIVNVTDTCTVVDTAGASHTYNSGQFLGICALKAANDQGAISAYTLQNFSFGLFLQSLNGTTPSATQFWNLYKNAVEATVGLADMTIATGDILKLQLTDFTDNSQIGSPIIFNIGTLTATPDPVPTSSGGGGGLNLHAPFDVSLALNFLAGAQHADGSFDSLLLSDWAAIAFAGGGAGDAAKKLAHYFVANPPTLSSVTDNERHAMALEALGINPYSGTSLDYIAPIVASFDGTQIGDLHLDNDDVFALFPLLHSGYTASDPIIQKTVAFILSAQNANGAWDESVDMTAATVQALSIVKTLPGVTDALAKALSYLHAEQKTDGGFGNSFSTSWVLQAISATSDSDTGWSQGYFTPQYHLATQQQTDGGVEPATKDAQTRVWATAYAIPAIGGKTWNSLLASFEKPTPPSVTSATSTVNTPTSTPEIRPQAPAEVPIAENALLVIPRAENPEEKKLTGDKKTDIVIESETKDASTTADQSAAVSVAVQKNLSGTQLLVHLWADIISFFREIF